MTGSVGSWDPSMVFPRFVISGLCRGSAGSQIRREFRADFLGRGDARRLNPEGLARHLVRAACLQNETAPKSFNFKTKNGPKNDPKLPRKCLSLVLLCRMLRPVNPRGWMRPHEQLCHWGSRHQTRIRHET